MPNYPPPPWPRALLRHDLIYTVELHRLAERLRVRAVTALGMVAAQHPRVRGWIAEHPELVRPPRKDERPRRKDIPRRVRELVYDRDGRRCLLCGATQRLSLDHVVFHSLGGPDTVENLRTLCVPCNSRRRPPRG